MRGRIARLPLRRRPTACKNVPVSPERIRMWFLTLCYDTAADRLDRSVPRRRCPTQIQHPFRLFPKTTFLSPRLEISLYFFHAMTVSLAVA